MNIDKKNLRLHTKLFFKIFEFIGLISALIHLVIKCIHEIKS